MAKKEVICFADGFVTADQSLSEHTEYMLHESLGQPGYQAI